MFIGTLEIELRASWVNSLKEKRMIVKSLIQRLKNRFNVSVCEIDKQDIHKNVVIGIALVATTKRDADDIIEKIVRYVEDTEEAVIIDIQKEVI